eukprot:TRINITY_DN46996_c0_g1_i1.p1 TRINITY_DN46996_c0_g1~~TRINITY_DN46996_c0_g1_i1.p1  ORF type:complete len:458 (+),score=133.80 TRINITY_DN46996_c0_g1_i1:56-1429(+)
MLRAGDSQLRQRRQPAPLEKPQSPRLLRTVKRLDIYPKVHRDHRDKLQRQTPVGACISNAVVGTMVLMFLVEVVGYVWGVDAYHDRLSVDEGIASKVPINLNITMHSIPCHELHIDMIDASGDVRIDLKHDLHKSPVDRNGQLVFTETHEYLHTPRDDAKVEAEAGSKSILDLFRQKLYEPEMDPSSPLFCGDCTVAPMARSALPDKMCCNTCSQVMQYHDSKGLKRPSPGDVEQCVYEASRRNPGCNMAGVLVTSKVKGNFHFSPGRSVALGRKLVHLFNPVAAMRYNISHTVHHLSFGDRSVRRFSELGTVEYPLDGHTFTVSGGIAVRKYLIKVIPVFYTTTDVIDDAAGLEMDAPASSHRTVGEDSVEEGASYEFSPRYDTRLLPLGQRGASPGLFFVYDFHPMTITHVFKRPPVTQFLLGLCKIGGGVFVVTGFLDKAVSLVLGRVVAGRQG